MDENIIVYFILLLLYDFFVLFLKLKMNVLILNPDTSRNTGKSTSLAYKSPVEWRVCIRF